MKFSNNQIVQESYDILKATDKPACPGCTNGISMCKYTPCMGTVEDMERLIDAGYAKNLMLDWWVGTGTVERITKGKSKGKTDNPFSEDLSYLSPALIGLGGQKAPFSKVGTCNLLVDDKCSLHDLGLKPIQGQTACCKREENSDPRIFVLHTWNTQKGRDLIARWKTEVGFTLKPGESEMQKLPETLPEMMEALLAVLKAKVDSGIMD